MRHRSPAHPADELLFQLRLEVNAAEHTGSEAVACQHRERALAYALELDRWLSGGNPPPTSWCAAFLTALTDGDVEPADVAVRAAETPHVDPPRDATCANQPLTAVPDHV